MLVNDALIPPHAPIRLPSAPKPSKSPPVCKIDHMSGTGHGRLFWSSHGSTVVIGDENAIHALPPSQWKPLTEACLKGST